jgi:N-acetylmuramoyl-L-alanine amidase
MGRERKGYIGMKIIDMPSPNFNERGGVKPSILLMHYTGMRTAQEALDRLTDAASEVSAHYTIDVDGTVYKHVEEAERAWHAGAGAWRNLTDINSHSIGIEIVNKGHEFGYEPFPETQIEAVKNLSLEIMVRHDIEPENVLAHSDIAPDRKQDPGELFPWHELAGHGIGVWPNVSVEDTVKSTGMDIFRALEDFGYHASSIMNQKRLPKGALVK